MFEFFEEKIEYRLKIQSGRNNSADITHGSDALEITLNLLLGPLPGGNVRDDAADRIDFASSVEQRELADDTGMRAVFVGRNFLKFQWDPGFEHLEIIDAK